MTQEFRFECTAFKTPVIHLKGSFNEARGDRNLELRTEDGAPSRNGGVIGVKVGQPPIGFLVSLINIYCEALCCRDKDD